MTLPRLAFAMTLTGCGAQNSTTDTDATASETSSGSSETGSSGIDYAVDGPWVVGNTSSTVDSGGRTLPVEFWYPAVEEARDAAALGQALSTFGVDSAQAVALSGLVDAAPPGCPRTHSASADSPPALAGPFPIVVFSHCHSCTRFSEFSVAERLASHGFVVAAVDHVDGTLFDELDGTPGDIDGDFLSVRGADITGLLDAIANPGSTVLPSALSGSIDLGSVGMFGHSFGAATTGRVLQDDDRVLAGVAIAAPMESPLLPGVAVANISEPVLYLLATEDNSITEIGNNLIRDNYMNATAPVWLAEVTDAGHWSFSDLVGLIDLFMPGCGEDMRQTVPTESFSYLAPSTAREIAQHMVTAFFAAQLLGDDDALEQVHTPVHAEVVSVRSRG